MNNNRKEALPKDRTLLSTKEAAYYLDISPEYLSTLRNTKLGPKYMQPRGKWGKISYHIDWLDEWIEKNAQL